LARYTITHVKQRGAEKFIKADKEMAALFSGGSAEWIRSPNNCSENPANYSTSRHHGDFDNDRATVTATLQRITGNEVATKLFRVRKTAASMSVQRRILER
jgi:hypothetical protein